MCVIGMNVCACVCVYISVFDLIIPTLSLFSHFLHRGAECLHTRKVLTVSVIKTVPEEWVQALGSVAH